MTQDALALYTKYYVATSYERLGLFTIVAASFASRLRALPGQFYSRYTRLRVSAHVFCGYGKAR